MRIAAFIQIVFAGLGSLGLGASVVLGCSSAGSFHGGLTTPAFLAAVLAAYVVFGVMSLKSPKGHGGVLGLLLLVPLVGAIASIFDFETRGLVLGGIPGALFGLTSLVMALKAKKARAGASS